MEMQKDTRSHGRAILSIMECDPRSGPNFPDSTRRHSKYSIEINEMRTQKWKYTDECRSETRTPKQLCIVGKWAIL